MKEPLWLSKEALLYLHGASLARFGGLEGIRDEGLLESALAKPLNTYHYGATTNLAELAAAYAFGIVKNHPCIDGNKRAAFLACGVFLEINGKKLVASQIDAIAAVLALADGTINQGQFAAWVHGNWK